MRAAKSQQQGVALITVLLVFALAAIIASEVASRHYRDIRKTANLLNSKQAYHYALAGEQYARQLLHRDIDEGPASDQLTDNWSTINPLFDIDNGAMTIEVTDLQGRFNLNNLVSANGRVNSQALADFKRLLEVLNISTDYSPQLIDWLDGNTQLTAGGAEDQSYQQQGYLAANQALSDRSELRLLQDMQFEDYLKLKDYVVALPYQVKDQQIGATKYNINTLAAKIVEALSGEEYSAIETIQQRGGHSTLGEWRSSGDMGPLQIAQNQLNTQSEFFEIKVTAVYDQRISIIRSQVYRNNNDGSITLLKRQQGIE
ncbi:type II secretion system minor pseudopilin GspK [Oceanicoccus sagamiensis]|uniref:Type II secretion system protein K n=1 Tax=Oceanicoccus sagamiensis TaxID=716816 RepID=A0A1X9NC23_9GAMM|nr:type II secretion system minor pseudopilin GspK [Oceanicoccus sagamiensis]ARN75598.1 hypothetical protein BST96_16690 [Oceanicoccus sagamiensis]